MATWHFPFDTDTGILIAAMIRLVVFQLWLCGAFQEALACSRGEAVRLFCPGPLEVHPRASESFTPGPEPQPGDFKPRVSNSDA